MASGSGASMILRMVLLLSLATASLDQAGGFRATSRRVFVDVSVLAGNVPVTGLSAQDFIITDNGVRQNIETVDVETMPLDISLVVDVSGSTSEQLEGYRRDIASVSQMIRPMDRLRLMTVETRVSEPAAILYSWTSAGATPLGRKDNGAWQQSTSEIRSQSSIRARQSHSCER